MSKSKIKKPSKPNKAPQKTMSPGPSPKEKAIMTALFNKGRITELEALFKTWTVRFPKYVDGWQALATILKQQGQSADVLMPVYKAIADLLPGDADAHFRLGNILLELRQLDGAIMSYHRALEIKPDFAEVHSNLGAIFLRQGRLVEAESCLRRSLAIEPNFTEAKINYAACVRHLTFTKDDSGEVRTAVTQALSDAWGRPSDLARVSANLVKLNNNIGETITKAAGAWPQRLSAHDLFSPANLTEIAADSLLHTLLISTPNCDIELERFLTMARKSMLDVAVKTAASDCENPIILSFYGALAQQCFINEYVFAWTDDEAAQARSLRDSLLAALETNTPVPTLWPVTVAAYFPLHSLPLANRLLNVAWPEAVSAVLKQQLLEPEEERQYRANIARLTPVEDEMSLLVQNQYEENPYPRWIKTGFAEKPLSINSFFRRHFPLSSFHPLDKDDAPDILIAGCGTGLQSIQTAQSFLGAQVLAVDLSLASLSYAKRKTQELGINAVEFAQADILKLGGLAPSFDIIESVGVLHHLNNPWAGWRVLLSLLRPGGLMRLGFYSETARRDIVQARSFIAEQGYDSTKEDIRRCRQDIMNLDEGVSFSSVMKATDFFSISECRDLLFHVQEHRMTLTGIEAFLRDNNLQFLGFVISDHILQTYRLRFPDDPAATNLAHWQIFENDNPYTFREMYQFWVQKTN